MNSAPGAEQRSIWSLWLAAAVVVIGGLAPFVFGGTSSRVDGVIVPFGIAALALVACAVLSRQSRTVLAVIYFVAGLAIVYGLLSMFSLPVRLAALGSCPALPAPCPSGLPRILTDGENNGMGSATALGILGLFIGFFGLVTIYRRPVLPVFTPPIRTIPPIPAPLSTPPPPAEASEPEAKPGTEAEPSATEVPTPIAAVELDEPELPAPEELAELPSHESSTAST